MEANDTRSGAPPTDDEVERVVAAGPHGAIAVAGVATLIVMAIWFGFYFFVFLPRGVVH
ncbi:hypothetical protein bAD24_I08910 [Burkholderia sp. AD24]|jgi:hypothetical protein|uniref:Cytochrome c oxidase subunit IIa family protein n=1 Tax=Paraburkholderia bryophila TaxID=420952 RepID=A0A329C9Z8_9BURK|nr:MULTISPECIES: hypothetical protein [Paraburkholderia]ASL43598.1 hypothetical protein bAD24_I08910 [Burkholderia sp. AD24]WKF58262.1 hypothetical protein HUO10_002760 [Paraburkholderia busanensis]RAS30927.1 hypothetical protein BX591_109104 [Paraburkholderia bryophila]WCM20289.1 hypothetical protein NDK50_02095 [Paraburkholderia bryophila]WGS50355.1 hypothetical protein LFL96_02275 [Paraburkholderia sp. D15]